MTYTFVLDEGVVISAHTGIDPNTGLEGADAYRILICISEERHAVAWSYSAWQKYHSQVNRYADAGRRPHVLQILRELASRADTFRAVDDEYLQPLEHPREIPEDDRLWVQLMLESAGRLVTTDGRLQQAVQHSAHYSF